MKQILLFFTIVFISFGTLIAQNIIGMADGRELEYQQLVLKQPLLSKSYLLAEDSIKYAMDKVNYYQINGDYFKKRFFENGGYEFMYREQQGTIELYSVVRTNQSYNAGTGISSSSSSKVNFYSKSNGSIKKANGKNLMMDLADCELCVQELKKAKTLNAISVVGLVAGLGIFIGTAASDLSKPDDLDKSTNIPPGLFVGGALCTTPWILCGARRKHISRSIEL